MTPEANGNGVHNSDPNTRTMTPQDRVRMAVENAGAIRSMFFTRYFTPVSDDVNEACKYPTAGQLNDPWYFRELYDREPIANRVVQLMPKECWQTTPLVYETEDPEDETPFESAWDDLGQALRGDKSWYQDEDGSPIWEHLKRADILSGVGWFGVILVGIDDGRNLDQPADGVMTLNPVTNCMWPSDPRKSPWLGGSDEEGSRELMVNRDGSEAKDVKQPSPLMVPVKNALGTVDFISRERAQLLVNARQLVVNAVTGEDGSVIPTMRLYGRDGGPLSAGSNAKGQRGFGPNQGRHEPDDGPAKTAAGPLFAHGENRFPGSTELDRDQGAAAGKWPTSFAGAQGTDAQYVGVELSPPEYPTDEPSKRERKLMFLRCFDEALVQVVQYEADIRNPRFGMPVMYRITLNDPTTQHSGIGLPLATVRVHWSRVQHLNDVGNVAGSSEIYSPPRLRPVLNPILDIRKVRGASAEGYWKACFTRFSLETLPQLGGDVFVDEEKTRAMLDQVFRDQSAGFVLSGMTAKTLAPSIVDPTPHIAVHTEAVCVQIGCPVRVFKGSERGELASAQDDSSWNDRVKERRLNYLTPRIIVPFIDRMISLGVLPVPKQGRGKPDTDLKVPKPQAPAAGGFGGKPPGGAPPPAKPIGNRRHGWRTVTRNLYIVRNADGDVLTKADKGIVPGDEVVGIKKQTSQVLDTPGGYSIEWLDLDSETKKDKAGVALQQTQALAAYIAGNCEALIPPMDYFTRVLGWDEDEATQMILDAKRHQEDTMTIPPAGDPDHPASESPEPPPKPINPLMVPKGTTFKGPGGSNPLGHPGGIAFTPKQPMAPGQAPGQPAPFGGGAPSFAAKGQTPPPQPIQNSNPEGINQYTVGGGNRSSEKANKASERAVKATAEAESAGTYEAHRAAWKAHTAAAGHHYDAGDETGTMATKSASRPGDESAQGRFKSLLDISHAHGTSRQAHLAKAEEHKAAAKAAKGPIQNKVFDRHQGPGGPAGGPYNPTQATGSEGEQVPRGTSSVEDDDEPPQGTPSEDERLQEPDADVTSRPTPEPSEAQRQHTLGGGTA